MTGIGTFFGIEIARRGMKVHQHALNITAQNLSNADTPGYSRQEAVLKVTNPYTNPSFNSSVTPGQFGTGVMVDKVRRIKDEYLDNSVRQSLSDSGYWQDQISFLERAEAIFNEPETSGIAGQINKFFKSWMALNNAPKDPGAKAVVVEYGQELAFMLSTAYKQLGDVHQNVAVINGSAVERGAMVDQVNQVNDLLGAIANIDKSIQKIYNIGQQPNDLMDQRDMLLEELSHFVPVEVLFHNNPQDGLSGGIEQLKVFGEEIDLEAILNGTTTGFSLSAAVNAAGGDDIILSYDGSQIANLSDLRDNAALGGSLLGLEKSRHSLLEYQDMLNQLSQQMKNEIAHTMAGTVTLPPGKTLDDYFFAGSLDDPAGFRVLDSLVSNPVELPGERAGEVASLRDEKWDELHETTFEDYFSLLISKVGSGVDSTYNMALNHQLINKQITALRDSVSGVSVDEELTKMIQFQYGFQASARVINTMDNMLDVIINKLF